MQNFPPGKICSTQLPNRLLKMSAAAPTPRPPLLTANDFFRGWPKGFRRITTRYDRLATNFLTAIHIAAGAPWRRSELGTDPDAPGRGLRQARP